MLTPSPVTRSESERSHRVALTYASGLRHCKACLLSILIREVTGKPTMDLDVKPSGRFQTAIRHSGPLHSCYKQSEQKSGLDRAPVSGYLGPIVPTADTL